MFKKSKQIFATPNRARDEVIGLAVLALFIILSFALGFHVGSSQP